MTSFDWILEEDKQNDLEILNTSLYLEHQGIWVYDLAARKLSNTDIGKTILSLAGENQADHTKHRDFLSLVIQGLGGHPVEAEVSYNLSSYLDIGEGNLDSDVNIAKLALAIEIDTAIAHTTESTKLKIPELILAGAGIANVESIHAARLRAVCNHLGSEIPVVPSAIISSNTRNLWVLKI